MRFASEHQANPRHPASSACTTTTAPAAIAPGTAGAKESDQAHDREQQTDRQQRDARMHVHGGDLRHVRLRDRARRS
jgi:hypothetical protein